MELSQLRQNKDKFDHFSTTVDEIRDSVKTVECDWSSVVKTLSENQSDNSAKQTVVF